MRILILGIDGYIGYPLALHLLSKDYEVCGVDNYSRRKLVSSVYSDSVTPIANISERSRFLRSHKNFIDDVASVHIEDSYIISKVIGFHKPDVIIHLAEQPSAPYSMMNSKAAINTQQTNTLGTLAVLWAMREHVPDAHLIKIGTMGEYGQPPMEIPDGVIPEECIGNRLFDWVDNDSDKGGSSPIHCPMSGMLFPRDPGSFYHASKVFDTYNINFACKTWGLTATDIMQGVVFGQYEYTDDTLKITRYDYDQYFGTVINRFVAQAVIGHSLTVYGNGKQVRSFLPLNDSIECLTLAIENPPKQGEYRTYNQFDSYADITRLAITVADMSHNILGNNIGINNLDNPRNEVEDHIYQPSNKALRDLGYKPSITWKDEIVQMLNYLEHFKDRINPKVIMPTTTWR